MPPVIEEGPGPCPLYEIILRGTPPRLKLVWADATRPKRWTIKDLRVDEAMDLTRLDLPESIDHTLVFRDSDLGQAWRVPVIDESGLPHLKPGTFSYADAIESYRRRITYAQSMAETGLEADAADASVADDSASATTRQEPLAYRLRQYADDMHVCLEHVRRLPAASYGFWFQRDLPRLLDHLLRTGGQGIVLVNMLWRVVSKEARPFDRVAERQWRAAVSAARPIVKRQFLSAGQGSA